MVGTYNVMNIKNHYFYKRRRQQQLYFKRGTCSQRLREAYHHCLLRNRSTTVNKVRGIEKNCFANYWRQTYPNGTLSWIKANNIYFLLYRYVHKPDAQNKWDYNKHSIQAFASVVLQYQTRALYSFKVGTHKFGHPFEAVSSTHLTHKTHFAKKAKCQDHLQLEASLPTNDTLPLRGNM